MHSTTRTGWMGWMGWMGMAGILAACGVASAEITLPHMFGDHAVLQRGEAVAIWGWAEAGETVTVAFAGQEKSGTVGDDGKWKVSLPALKANATGQPLTVTGTVSPAVTVSDVLVGEVWMASGQSNMHWGLHNTEGGKEEIASATLPGLRMFLTDLKTAAEPQDNSGGQWLVTTPENAGKFSAVGYYFGKRLHEELGVPVGIIRNSWGGKPSEAFTTREKLASKPEGRALVDLLEKKVAAYDPAKARAKHEKQMERWMERVAEIKAENAVADAEATEGGGTSQAVKKKRLPPKPVFEEAPNLRPSSPQAIYNAMIHPWVGYGMKGAIWYQGESNRNRAKQYETIFPLLIEDWRERWGKDFPFYFVQLANFQKPSTEPGVPDAWAELQNAQRLALALPRTGMAVTNDIGAANDIHPRNKREVGERLARWALHRDYGRTDVVVSGPLYRDCVVEGNRIRVRFDHAEGLKTRAGGPLKRFEIAGGDRKWHWAEAAIDGGSVVVSSKDVPQPVAVRYAWAANPTGANLVNGEGLPASVFRTDDWKLSTED